MNFIEKLVRESIQDTMSMSAPDFTKIHLGPGPVISVLEELKLKEDPSYALFKRAQMRYENRTKLEEKEIDFVSLNKFPSMKEYKQMAAGLTIKIPLKIGQKTKIPTLQSHYGRGTLEDIPLYPLKNIEVTLQCRSDIDTENEIWDDGTYPKLNPIEEAESIKGKYVFRTNYAKKFDSKKLPNLEQSAEWSEPKRKQYSAGSKLPDSISSKVRKETLFDTLIAANFFATTAIQPDKPDYTKCNDFEALIGMYLKDGHIKGDCKCASNLVAGTLDSLGLAVRRVGGAILDNKKTLHPLGGLSDLIPHVWAEVYIPTSEKEGFWAPVDPFQAFLIFPKIPLYLLTELEVPKFLNARTKNACITVDYI